MDASHPLSHELMSALPTVPAAAGNRGTDGSRSRG
jgi:hypothetical protein